eukprot:SAG31_NODE_8195_length_1498_cov_1.918513_2_plen_169_part_00
MRAAKHSAVRLVLRFWAANHRARESPVAMRVAASRTPVLVLLHLLRPGAAIRSRRWRQNCAATNPACRVPFELRADSAFSVPPGDPAAYPPGHLKPVGHPDFAPLWDGEIDVLDTMEPRTFWEEYCEVDPLSQTVYYYILPKYIHKSIYFPSIFIFFPVYTTLLFAEF